MSYIEATIYLTEDVLRQPKTSSNHRIVIDITDLHCMVNNDWPMSGDLNGHLDAWKQKVLLPLCKMLQTSSGKITCIKRNTDGGEWATWHLNRDGREVVAAEPSLIARDVHLMGTTVILEPTIPLDHYTVTSQVKQWASRLSHCLISGEIIQLAHDGEMIWEFEAVSAESVALIPGTAMVACQVPRSALPASGSRLATTFQDYIPTRIIVRAMINSDHVKDGLIHLDTFHNDLPTTSSALSELMHEQIRRFGWHEFGFRVDELAIHPEEGVDISNIIIYVYCWTKVEELVTRELPIDDASLAIAWSRAIRQGIKMAMDHIRAANRTVFGDTSDARARRNTNHWAPIIADNMGVIISRLAPHKRQGALALMQASNIEQLKTAIVQKLIVIPANAPQTTNHTQQHTQIADESDDDSMTLGLLGHQTHTVIDEDL